MHTVLIVCGEAEKQFAEKAYGTAYGFDKVVGGTLDLGGKVSRKKNFIPPLNDAIASGEANEAITD